MRWLIVAGAIWLLSSSADAEETSCPNEETLRSRYRTAPTEITFINDTGGPSDCIGSTFRESASFTHSFRPDSVFGS
jgi:hypothetical protein